MSAAQWFLLFGLLLVGMTLISSRLERWPFSTALCYLLVGLGVGPAALGALTIHPVDHAALLERLTEGAVIVSLFVAGLKMRVPLGDRRWRLALGLATVSMVLTVAMAAAAGVWLFGLPLGAAVVLGAVLAPTDPVLASDVQLEHPGDEDRLRFGLTGEAGLNDGTAFPFVMLGLGLLGVHDLGAGGWRWVAVDVLWGVLGGVGIGAALGWGAARVVLWQRRERKEATGLDEFLALGMIALCYGAALLAHTLGFMAVFAGAVMLRRLERTTEGAAEQGAEAAEEAATHPRRAPAHLAGALLRFNEQVERLLEIALVLGVGVMLWFADGSARALGFAALLFLVIRPLASWPVLRASRIMGARGALVAWFGVRGIGSLYYLAYACTHGLPPALASPLAGVTLTVVAASILLHGVSVTPLMDWYERRLKIGPPAHARLKEQREPPGLARPLS